VLLAATVWLGCVFAVATVAWFAIDSAGRQVTVIAGGPIAQGVGSAGASSGAGPDDGVLARPMPSATSAGPTVRPTVGGAVVTSPDDVITASPAVTSTAPRPSRTGRSHSTPPPTQTSTPKPSPSDRSTTVYTRGGSVTFTCHRDRPIEYVVKPDQGWRGSGKVSGPNEANVEFTRDVEEIGVHAWCVDGRPRTEVDDHSKP
jgi:hypothetical protein